MKAKILYLAVLLSFFYLEGFSQWNSLPGTVNPIGTWPSVSIADSSNIFIGGNDANGIKIAYSSNGGTNFTTLPTTGITTSGRMVGCITALSPTTIFVGDGNKNGQVITDARLYKSVNAGSSWTLVLNTGTGVNGYFNGVVFSPTAPSFGITGSDPATNNSNYKVCITKNNGNNWTQINFNLTGVVMGKGSMFCVDSNFYGFGSNHDFIYTKNGGTNWNSVSMTGLTNLVSSIAFDNSGTYGIGVSFLMGSNTISYTSNGGLNWSSVTPVSTVSFSNAQGTVKWIPGSSVVFVTISDANKTYTYRSLDNGTSWSLYNSTTTIRNLMDFGVYFKYGHATLYGITSGGTPVKIADAPMPVALESFNYSVISNSVNLKWITSEEINNAGFEIYRIKDSDDPNNPLMWTKIGYVTGKGNKNGFSQYSFTDSKLASGKYHYKLKQIDYNGNFAYYSLNGTVNIGLPNKSDMHQNYPNPFNPVTTIDYNISFDGRVTLKIYDMAGKEVSTLVNELQTAGYYSVSFDASKLSSGNYIYRLESGSNSIVKILTLVK